MPVAAEGRNASEDLEKERKEKKKQNLQCAVTTFPSANRALTMADLQLR